MLKEKKEITMRAILISIVLTIILATTNTYLALKIGILPSASIPAAIISMSILRFFKNYSILENNLIQTAASAGQAVVGGIVYTAPSLIIIHYWLNFPYWKCLVLAFLGGVLGVLFSIPLRKKLMRDPQLPFPEGKAIAAVLQVAEDKNINMRKIISGGAVGALFDLFQSGFKVIAENFQFWFISNKAIFGMGTGFSAAMIGTGYLVGFNIGGSLLLGGILGWVIGMPLLSAILGFSDAGTSAQTAMAFWDLKLRYISIGAMLFAGLFSLLVTLKPSITKSLITCKSLFFSRKKRGSIILGTERDLPNSFILICLMSALIALFILFQNEIDSIQFNVTNVQSMTIVCCFIIYILFMGFIFAAMCGYFSGLLGVSGSPGSGVIVAGALIVAVLFNAYLGSNIGLNFSHSTMLHAEGIIILVTSIIACIAAIACDNIQDLKVGHIIGATPWKQQVMLLLGILIASAVIPVVMQLLFETYGIAGISNQSGIDQTQTLSAPPAAMIASVIESVFNDTVPWELLEIGAAFIVCFIIFHCFFNKNHFKFSIIGIATGMYLPLTTTVPLFIGSLLSQFIKRHLNANKNLTTTQKEEQHQSGFLIASGLLCGAALMQVVLAGIFAWYRNSEILRLLPESLSKYSIYLAFITTICLFRWVYIATTVPYESTLKIKTASSFMRKTVVSK
ncbi:MAG: oligopeptide transporter, OPT family [Tatlockia sp.]|nr:oligopeptide transporter, OPT family [Tatlockia sp.]MBA3978035.1 oligopeptide transporter, OPT family [Nitrosopumilus sp.]